MSFFSPPSSQHYKLLGMYLILMILWRGTLLMTQYYTTLWLAKGTENKTERKQVRISADWRQSITLFTRMSEELNSGLASHVKVTGVLFVSLRGRKCRFWSFLQFSGWRANPIIHKVIIQVCA